MENINEVLKKFSKKNYDLLGAYNSALKNERFKKLVDILSLKEEVLCKYTSKLQDATVEINNCSNCKGLMFCKNEVSGYFYTPMVSDDKLIFIYSPCSYKIKEDEKNAYKRNIELFSVPSSLQNAKLKDIYTDDKSRIEVIIYINDYIKNYFKDRKKGIYLTGNFGSGKTYLISALFNELAKEKVNSAIIYFPEFLRSLKSSFVKSEIGNTYDDKFEYIKKIPLLLIDDIGAENLSLWARDEILGTILQYRMEENLPTFFTSNLTLEELELHLELTGNKVDKIKARRIIERIKYLTDEMKLIGIDRRK